MEEDDLIAPASPWPMTAGHLGLVVFHVVVGAVLIGVNVLAPPWAGLDLEAALGSRFSALTADDLRWGISGMVAFATIVGIVASSLVTVAGFRLVAGFRKLDGLKRSLALVIALLIAHGIGCAAGIGAVLLASGVAYVG